MTTQSTERPTAFESAARAAAKEAESSIMRKVLLEQSDAFQAEKSKSMGKDKSVGLRAKRQQRKQPLFK